MNFVTWSRHFVIIPMHRRFLRAFPLTAFCVHPSVGNLFQTDCFILSTGAEKGLFSGRRRRRIVSESGNRAHQQREGRREEGEGEREREAHYNAE